MIAALGYGIMAAAALVVGVVLIMDDVTVVGIANDALAVACITAAIAYTVMMLDELGICAG
ncbi:MAG: hypothetical protein MR430_00900 [Lachnospiraceae bacterium]|nr:hypothetical protein [Lachnospiraceae bacterium]